MNAQQIIYHLLSNASAVTDLVGDRIYPVIPNKDIDLPCIAYHEQPTDQDTAHTSIDLTRSAFTLSAWTYDFETLQTLVAAIKSTLHLYRGTISGTFVNLVRIINVFENPEIEGFHKEMNINVVFRS